MAESCRLGNFKFELKTSNSNSIVNEKKHSFLNVFCAFVSIIIILASFTTDTLLIAEYCRTNHTYYALGSVLFLLLANILIHIFSMRWLILDMKASLRNWLTHLVLVGVIDRYITLFENTFKYMVCNKQSLIKTISIQRNDLILLHFLYAFIGTVQQIILQSYSVITLPGDYYTQVISLTVSMVSVLWACTMYICTMTVEDRNSYQWLSFILKMTWHFGMLIARIAGILLFTVIFGIWTLVPMGIHWAAMTFWIVTQKTTFCPNKLEETFYNVVMGFIYCFCYINLREGHTRYRLMVFYTFMVTQNFASLFLFILISNIQEQRKIWSIIATVSIVAGTVIGICSMLLYYRWFHSKGPITWKNVDAELNNKVTEQKTETTNKTDDLEHVRSFKSLQNSQMDNDSNRKEAERTEVISKSDIETADRKFLLDHWIARSGTPTFVSVPIGNNSTDVSSVEFHTVENTPQSIKISKLDNLALNGHILGTIISKHKKHAICSPTELNLKLSALQNIEGSIDELISSNINIQKRRGICSSDAFKDDLESNINNEDFDKVPKNDHSSEISQETESSNKKTSSDSIDMDLDLSFSDINSSDINTFNENIVQKLCLSALKNIKVGNQDADIENIQRIALDILKEMYAKKGKKTGNTDMLSAAAKRDIETPTEMLSVHDYENVCAVNIAREVWGLRSWKGYCDIENWLHDGSVVRDRRRDTLTSESSEISSCISQDLKNCILSAPPVHMKRTPHYSNVYVKYEKTGFQNDYVNTVVCNTGHGSNSLKENKSASDLVFAAPCVIDNGTNHLEPIIEELDDLGDIGLPSKKRLNSESSLVATIDEIRKATVTSSPRNVYHRREHVWDSPQLDTSSKLESNLKRALWKEPSKFNLSNIMESLPEKENTLNESHDIKFDANKKEMNIPIPNAISDISGSRYSVTENIIRHQQKYNNLRTQVKKTNNKRHNGFKDNSSKDIDYLWRLVSDNSVPLSSNEDISTNQVTSSLHSLIFKDTRSTNLVNVVTSTAKSTNNKKGSKNRPRRKFSILRERFEPKLNKNSDEEALYQYSSESLNELQQPEHSKAEQASVLKLNNPLCSENNENSVNKSQKLPTIPFETTLTSQDMCTRPELSRNIKEKRSLFMKQVLSPPKFSTKLKYKV